MWLSPCRLAVAGCTRRFSRGSQLLPSCPFASGLPLFLPPFPLQSWMFVISQHPAHTFMNNSLFNLPQITLLLLYFLFPAETWTDKLSFIKVCCRLPMRGCTFHLPGHCVISIFLFCSCSLTAGRLSSRSHLWAPIMDCFLPLVLHSIMNKPCHSKLYIATYL